MSDKIYTFELTIRKKDQGGILAQKKDEFDIQVLNSPAGQSDSITTEGILKKLSPYLSFLVDKEKLNRDVIVELGRLLFQGFLPGKIEQFYRSSRANAEAQGAPLHFRLRVETNELAEIPWEFIYDLERDNFLARSAELPFTRFVPIAMEGQDLPDSTPLRVLTVVSSPTGTKALDSRGELQALKEALKDRIDQNKIVIENCKNANLEEIRESLRSFKPHIFHFLGHGIFENQTGYVLLEKKDRTRLAVDDERFREFFSPNSPTKLVVLNTCKGGEASSGRAFSGMAAQLLRRGMPAVAAMQFSVLDDSAIIFAKEFYRELAVGAEIDVAMNNARKAIYQEPGFSHREWGTPVLFLRSPGYKLMKPDVPNGPNGDPDCEKLKEEKRFLEDLLAEHKDGLRISLLQKSQFGVGNVPLQLLKQIKATEREIAETEKKISEVKDQLNKCQ